MASLYTSNKDKKEDKVADPARNINLMEDKSKADGKLLSSAGIPHCMHLVLQCLRLTGIVFLPADTSSTISTIWKYLNLGMCILCNLFRLISFAFIIALSFYRDMEGSMFNIIMRNLSSIIYRTLCLGNAIALFAASLNAIPHFMRSWQQVRLKRLHKLQWVDQLGEKCEVLSKIQMADSFGGRIYSLFIVLLLCLAALITSMLLSTHLYSFWEKLLDHVGHSNTWTTLLLTVVTINEVVAACSYVLPSLLMYTFCLIVQHEFKVFNISLEKMGHSQSISSSLLNDHRRWHQQICALVRDLNAVFSLYSGMSLILSVGLICVMLYTTLWIDAPHALYQTIKFALILIITVITGIITLYSSAIINDEVYIFSATIHNPTIY